MSEPEKVSLDLEIDAWVGDARSDPIKYRDRRVTHIFLTAIGLTPALQDKMYLKGGALMMLAFASPRGTQDIDFTVSADPEPFASDLFELLNPSLLRAAAQLGYIDLVCRAQTLKRFPRATNFETAVGPALRLTIAHAKRSTNEEKRLESGTASQVLQVDLSFKEPIIHSAEAKLGRPVMSIQAYALEDIIAEKLRALLQQPLRNRSRRQDVYDIGWLLNNRPINADFRSRIFDSMIRKGAERDVKPTIDSFDNPELRRRAGMNWDTLELELNELPKFDVSFSLVRDFYRSLPWGNISSDTTK
jgi:hypothetical protein